MNLFFMIFFGILLAPLAVALTYIVAKLMFHTVIMMYAEAFSVMGYDGLRRYVDRNIL